MTLGVVKTAIQRLKQRLAKNESPDNLLHDANVALALASNVSTYAGAALSIRGLKRPTA